jgi:hypothetical protein
MEMKINQARQHMERIKRSFARIQSQGADDQSHDDLMHFFEDCWHLKDYAKACLPNDQQKQLETEIDNYQHLKIVADIANRSKHAILTKNVRVDAEITHKHIHASDGKNSPPATAKYTITIQDDAHDIAREAIAAWQTILTKYKL